MILRPPPRKRFPRVRKWYHRVVSDGTLAVIALALTKVIASVGLTAIIHLLKRLFIARWGE